MAVYYVDADELDGIATATSNTRNDLWWTLKPIDAVAWGVPWPGDTRGQWEKARHIINFELGWLDNDARALRDRSSRVRVEAAVMVVASALLAVSRFTSETVSSTRRGASDANGMVLGAVKGITLTAFTAQEQARRLFAGFETGNAWIAKNYSRLVLAALPALVAAVPMVALNVTLGIAMAAVWVTLTSSRRTETSAPPPDHQEPPKQNVENKTKRSVIEDSITEKHVSELRFDRVAAFKHKFLDVIGVTWRPGPNGAIEGPHDSLDGQCVSLVKRYIVWADPQIGNPPTIEPLAPGAAYSANWEKIVPTPSGPLEIKAGDVVYFKGIKHVAIALSDARANGDFEILESNAYVAGKTNHSDATQVRVTTSWNNSGNIAEVMRPK
jgi:hypothetical protein